jgi:site-specific DNA recombinase
MAAKLRCAIYTRKSSDEGLEQEFNSLHAQREACEAYVKSQRGEGWSVLKTGFDDGGISGGTLDRPGLKAMMAEVEAGRIDVVVVYKVDRLTRSLMDFARLVEAFDRKGVSFVSVTQAFNTTTSMGRLTLNVLLSFAQFEREVTGERIRDKIAASKAKGMWMGGVPALGYDIGERELVINPAEAELLRRLFRRYLELGTVNALKAELDRDGVRSKAWVTRAGRQMGGQPLSRGALFHLLNNRLFLGEIVHKGVAHPGRHEPIIDRALFDAVQDQLAANTADRRQSRNRSSAAKLKGLIFDQDGGPMGPSFGYGKGGKIFRYYVSTSVQRAEPRSSADDAVRRVSASQLEDLLADRLARLGVEGGWGEIERVDILAHMVRLKLRPERIAASHATPAAAIEHLKFALADGDQLALTSTGSFQLTLAVRPVFRGGRTWLVNPAGKPANERAVHDKRLIAALRQAHALVRASSMSPLQSLDDHRTARSIDGSYGRKIAELAFLAPDIQSAIFEGRQPPGLTFTHIMERGVPFAWADQRAKFGFA